MDYREQLEYIKSHEVERDQVPKKQRKKQNKRTRVKRKIGVIDRFLWMMQLLASAFVVFSMLVLNILPPIYMLILVCVVLIFLIVVKLLQKRACRSRKKRGSGKLLSMTLTALFVIIGFYGFKVNSALDEISVSEQNSGVENVSNISVTEEPFNIYISGIDVYGEITKESRSDVNLIMTVDPQNHKILLTTTPRDYYVTIPGVSGDQRDKLTHAGTYGVETSMATLENLYDTEIPFYVRVNFTSVEEIIDVMGGVNVESELAFKTSKAAGAVVDVKEGANHFNGKQALAFVRERKALPTGDNQRGKNQQALLSAMIQKAVSPMILFRANEMINSVAGNAETNISEAQMKALIRMQLNDLKGWDIESVAAEGDDSGKQYCYSYQGGPLYVTVPYEESVSEISEKIKKIIK